MTKTEHETRGILHAAAKAATEAQVEARAAVAIACLIHDDDLDERAEREFGNARHDHDDAVERLADLESRYSGMDAATGTAPAKTSPGETSSLSSGVILTRGRASARSAR